ncbi:MAG TPA: hypothetical protein DCR14_00010 [Acidimicrobiaceae bacterium]|nr:hypothetical protein [Acidimicrobiaceae bacterium]
MVAASNDSSGPVWLLIFGPVAGGGVYYGLWQYYRNTNKSHSFETETKVTAQPITGTDRKVSTVTGTKRSSIDGNNVSDHRRRVQRIP